MSRALRKSVWRFAPKNARLLCEGNEYPPDGPDELIAPPQWTGEKSRLIFTGTGNSTGTPRPICLMTGKGDEQCRVSHMAMRGAPDRNRNYRLNPGMLIQHVSKADRSMHCIQIDIGKTYREAVLRWYPRFGVPHVDAVIITHDHADACFGLDELRTVQKLPKRQQGCDVADVRAHTPTTPVFVSPRHMPKIRSAFPYLIPEAVASQSVNRFVAKIDFLKQIDFQPMVCPGGLEITPVPVFHGKDYLCQAFVFGTKDRIAYLSDISAVPDETMAYLQKAPIDLLVLDCLFWTHHATHLSFDEAVDLARKLRPKRTLLVGMSDQFEHHETNARLRQLLSKEQLDVQLAHDGLCIDVEL
eukprot:TRINITY_DN13212_c0_g2_i1.p1 TRINITY_DN13212_c0_g2~~TRINITY_DN13212_c0_g2_i1.p1  ORF type:complete len:357 (+),score=49.23 TRINITY_DN13212_c0_g2_i1:75-1145(+)